MVSRKTPQRRLGVLILLSLLLHVFFYLGVDWRWLFMPETEQREAEKKGEKDALTIQFKLAPPQEEPAPPQEEKASLEAAAETEPVVTRQDEPDPKPTEEPAAEESHVLVHNADKAGSSNQQSKDAGAVVFGADTPSSKPAAKPGDVKKQEALDAMAQSQRLPPAPDVDQPRKAELAREGEKRQEVLTTRAERALWSTPERDKVSGERDAKGDRMVTLPESGADAAKQALRQRVEEDLKALFGEDFSRETHRLEKLEEIDIPDLETPGEGEQAQGNLNMLSDPQLREVGVEQPYSEQQSEELRLVNRILERMNQQVIQYWVNPYKGGHIYRGVIKVELDENGYLRDAYVYHPSGLVLLDISVLDAIRAVKRYEVPENKILAERYYSNLSFHYSSIDEKPELMPFEREASKAKSDTAKRTTTKETP